MREIFYRLHGFECSFKQGFIVHYQTRSGENPGHYYYIVTIGRNRTRKMNEPRGKYCRTFPLN